MIGPSYVDIRYPLAILKKLGITHEQADQRNASLRACRYAIAGLNREQRLSFRHKVAYVHRVGLWPPGTHLSTKLRIFFVCEKVVPGQKKKINPDFVLGEGLDDLPNVKAGKVLQEEGYEIRPRIDLPLRRSYRWIWMENPNTGDRVTVLLDGTPEPGWIEG